MEKFNFNIEVINNDKTIFKGLLLDWLLIQEGGETTDILYIVHLFLPLINNENDIVTETDFNTGKWIFKRL